jgi:hypothetical protein
MVDERLLPGTLVWRKDVHVGLVNHYGVVLQTSPCFVAHIDKSATRHLRVKVESFEEFAAGLQVTFEPVAEPVPLDEMWVRVNDVAQAKRPFGLLCWGEDWNCESFARFVRDGLPKSEQAVGANLLLGVAAVIGVLALAASGEEASEGTQAASGVRYDVKARRYRDSKGRFATA